MTDLDRTRSSGSDSQPEVPCPLCSAPTVFSGLPDVAGPVYFRFYRCPHHGLIRIDADDDNAS